MTSMIQTESAILPTLPSKSSTYESPNEKSLILQPLTSVAVGPQRNISDPFKNHLMLPEIPDKARKKSQRTPAAISSAAWRKYYEDREEIKNKKQETIRKRKIERTAKQEQKKTQKIRKVARKRQKKPHPIKRTADMDTLHLEYQKENVPDTAETHKFLGELNPENDNSARKRTKQVAAVLTSKESIKSKRTKLEKKSKIQNRKPRSFKNKLESTSEEEDLILLDNEDSAGEDCEYDCLRCGENYYKTEKIEDWIQCIFCHKWMHENCTPFENTCDTCGILNK
ncbi:uncharacterized protein C01G6.5-like [Maniola jurtina]|uniref:uncharacterized protein C01G6.5-like n=1 Tax=Maniola jurtina TaxID=191418 RepID=UPI001E68B439|nr:uncharacterized protein C01G6.5-like [Maniola jurtina]